MLSFQIVAIILSIILLVFVLELVRKGMLKERYSILWITSSLVLLVLSLWKGLLDRTAKIVGIYYSPSLLFLVAFVFLLLIVLHFSIVISIMRDRNKKIAQDVGLLKLELENLKTKKSENKEGIK
jgi:hypothetical protein